MIYGHPQGLPLKVTDGGTIVDELPGKPFFRAELDVFGGNSGSAVFNNLTGQLIGIVSRGPADLDEDIARKCNFPVVLPAHKEWGAKITGEEITKSTEFYDDFISLQIKNIL